MKKIRLGVNIDHVATLRQARREAFPDVVAAAREVISAGADGIVVHLREDRRHVQDRDVISLRGLRTRLDLEMAMSDEIKRIALRIRPDMVTLVPEKREELTTEGGLDVVRCEKRLKGFVRELIDRGIIVSLFVDPIPSQIRASAGTGAQFVEIHTGAYANSRSAGKRASELRKIRSATALALKTGLRVNAGHGLDYRNARAVAAIKGIEELNIGFSIIARSVFVGLKTAVSEMTEAIRVS